MNITIHLILFVIPLSWFWLGWQELALFTMVLHQTRIPACAAVAIRSTLWWFTMHVIFGVEQACYIVIQFWRNPIRDWFVRWWRYICQFLFRSNKVLERLKVGLDSEPLDLIIHYLKAGPTINTTSYIYTNFTPLNGNREESHSHLLLALNSHLFITLPRTFWLSLKEG